MMTKPRSTTAAYTTGSPAQSRPDWAAPTPDAGSATNSWQEHASCRQHDPELFFALDGERAAARAEREAKAKAICETCPVRRPCLDQALAGGEKHGIWGGTSEEERAALVRRRRRAGAA